MKPKPTSRVPFRALALATLALTLVFGGLFLLLFERVQGSESVGPSGRALRDNYWAATLLLEEMGVSTTARYGLGELPEPDADAVLIILAADPIHRSALADRLVPWVEQGGHVVITPPPTVSASTRDLMQTEDGPSSAGPQDPLFEAFGIPIQPAPAPTPSEALVEVHTTAADGTSTVGTILTQSRLGVGVSPCEAVVGTSRSTTGADLRMQLRARCARGSGLVTALSSDDLLHNRHLQDGRADNAAFFWESVAPKDQGEAPTQAIFVLRGDAPGFMSLIWGRAWPALTSLALLLLAWAHFEGQRFGLRFDRSQHGRRSMLEHLDAAGNILWRSAQQECLVGPMRAAVRSRLARRIPALAQLQGSELAEAAAEATGRPLSMVHVALVAPPPVDRPGFVRMARALQAIWRDA